MEYVSRVLSSKYLLPGLEFQKYLAENESDIPDKFRDRMTYYLPGAAMYGHDDRCQWEGVSFSWNGENYWHGSTSWHGRIWWANNRILLVEK